MLSELFVYNITSWVQQGLLALQSVLIPRQKSLDNITNHTNDLTYIQFVNTSELMYG